jgi:hypothetical protein
LDANEIFKWVLIIGSDLFTFYAVYKVVQYAYWWVQDRGKEEEF